MEFNFNDVPMTDPFLSLDTNLDDISAVIQMDSNESLRIDEHWPLQPSSSTYRPPYARPNQHSPPQEYYDPVKSQEINSIVSLLQSDSPTDDPYAAMKFSPPNLDTSSLTGTGRMLPQLSIPGQQQQQNIFYQPGTLAHHLAAPAMQPAPVMSPPAMYVDTQVGTDYNMDQKPVALTSPSVKMEMSSPQPATHASPRATSSTSTKEELLRMIMNMSPSEVERLKSKEARPPRPSAVATRVTKDHDGTRGTKPKWSLDEEDDDGDDMDEDETPVRKGPKTERRTAHNLIEKKYRCSINDRIQHLKTMLAGDDAKLSKSATLRKAIEHIEALEAENSELRTEVDRLILVLRAHQIEIPVRSKSPLLSPSTSSNSLQSPSYSSGSPMSPSEQKQQGVKRPRLDQTRLTMFAFMFAMLIFNPISLLASSASAHQDNIKRSPLHAGRVLDNDFDDPSQDWWQRHVVRPAFIWSVNIFVVICVLTRLLVYGEPVQDFKSRTWTTFLASRQRARVEAESLNFREAMRQYIECLQILERPLPSAGLDELISVIWQIVRHFLNGLWIGRWISRRRRDAMKPVTVVCKSHAHTAVIYHKLHQLQMMGIDETNVSGLYLALSAVNLAESAGASIDGLPRNVMADIYIGAAIRTRLCLWPPFAKIISMYFYRRAQRHVRRAEESSVNGLHWMFHPLGREFLADPVKLESVVKRRDLKLTPFVSEAKMTPMSFLRSQFKVTLLDLLAGELSGQLDHEIDVMDISRLLLAMSTGVGLPKKCNDWDCDTTILDGDAMATWWTHVLTCAIMWKQGHGELAKKHYTVIRHCPKELLNTPLSLAVGNAFCARKICVDDRNNAKFGEFVFMHTRKALEIMRDVVGRHRQEETMHLYNTLCRLSYEWVMISLLDAWRQGINPKLPYWIQPQKLDYRTLYQEACNHYSYLNDIMDLKAGYRLTVYQLASRMLNGGNPLHTWTVVSKISKQRMAAVEGRGQMQRWNQPEPFHLHVLSKMHSNLSQITTKLK